MDTMLILEIVAALTTICAGGFGRKYRQFKCKWNEFTDVVVAVDEALKDDKITTEELKKILKEVSDLKE